VAPERKTLAGSTLVVERFFRPRGKPPTVLDSGFLSDPESPLGKIACSHVCRSVDLTQHRCLVIFGEPGMGKSTTMLERRRSLPPDATFFDLRYRSGDDVLNAARVADWVRGDAPLHLVIDSIDEASSPDFARRLVGTLSEGPAQTLRLELACRAGEWPAVLEEQLPFIFGPDEAKFFHIEPLRRQDVAEIAGSIGIAAKEFLQAVTERGLEPLASIPLTLELLLKVYSAHRSMPARATALYEEACHLLCSESSATRSDASMPDAQRTINVASAIAAAMIFGRRTTICSKSRFLENATELSVDGFVDLKPLADVSTKVVVDTLRAGLFTLRGHEVTGWYHQVFPEYLAARWIRENQLSPVQIRQLLFHQEDANQLVPQLSGVATWLACWDAGVLMLLAQFAPEHFINADSDVATDQHRETAVRSLMQRAQDLTLTHRWWDSVESRRLNHPRLDVQLQSIILDPQWNALARAKALEIAAANSLHGLTEALCAVALDKSAPPSVRAHAVTSAFACTQDRSQVAVRLGPLAEPGDPIDDKENVRVAILRELWPEFLDAAELFRLLTPPQKKNHFGGYQAFIHSVGDQLREQDLAEALSWAERNTHAHDRFECMPFEYLVAKICRAAWEHIDQSAIRIALARAVSRVLSVYRNVFAGPGEADYGATLIAQTERRRLLISQLAELAVDPSTEVSQLVHPYGHQPPFALEEDMAWALSMWRTALVPQRQFWEALIKRLVMSRKELATLELVLDAVGDLPSSPLLPFPTRIEVDSDEGRAARGQYQVELGWQRDHMQWNDTVNERASTAQADLEADVVRAINGDLQAWWQVTGRLWTAAKWEAQHDLASLLQWNSLGPDRQAAYLRLMQSYLLAMDAAPEQWLSLRHVFHWPALAGYLSLSFIREQAADWFEKNRRDLSRRWTTAVVGFDVHHLSNQSTKEAHRALVQAMFDEAPLEALATVRTMLRRELSSSADLAFLWYLPSNEPIGALLAARHADAGRIENFVTLFDALLHLDRSRALRLARRFLLGDRAPEPGHARVNRMRHRRRRNRRTIHLLGRSRRHSARQLKISIALLADGQLDAWKIAWAACARYPDMAQIAISDLTDRFGLETWGVRLREEDLAVLYTWLQRNRRDAEPLDTVTARGAFRSRLLTQLVSRASQNAVQVLFAMQRKFPDDVNLKAALADASYAQRELSWRPIEPAALFQLPRFPRRRIVQSSEHLLELALVLLDDYEQFLHGEPPAIRDLWSWDQGKDRAYWPKDENDLSDHLKRYLERTAPAILANREIQIRPTEVRRPGEELDLLVQAKCPITDATFNVVIEVKGSWNKNLETDLRGQLSTRYLVSHEMRCGIYLVGWFSCVEWKQSDWRRDATQRREKGAVEALLTSQATDESIGSRTVRARVLDAELGAVSSSPIGER
jgi:hypothetical protein